jgi:alpha-amylase
MSTTNTRGVMFQYFEWNCKDDGSLWRELAGKAHEIKNLGTTAIWFPPAAKCMGGAGDTGYATYDLYDLGEFDQKGTVRTKYGTRDEFLAAVNAVRDAGMDVYCDIVLDHRMGGDELEEVEVEKIDQNDRNVVIGQPYKIKAWSRYTFPGRKDKYSAFKWSQEHFLAFGYDHNHPDEKGCIYRKTGKTFSGEVDFEHGNFDYLMGADVDHYNKDVHDEELAWGRWFVETTNLNGFRLDAVKHVPASFFKDWLACLREHFTDRELFAVGEYWSADIGAIQKYIDVVGGSMRVFDVPLHFHLSQASKQGRDYDLRQIFDNTLVKNNPLMAVTFVDNHDSQPGQALESWVDDWFKPIAYALILLREHGYPCLFYGDYFGNPGDDKGNNKLTSHRKLMDDFLVARSKHTYGVMTDYFDHPQCVGWSWSGDAEHPGGLAVVLSTGDNGSKKMVTKCAQTTFRDVTGHWPEPVTTDENGEGTFPCPGGNVSVWQPV